MQPLLTRYKIILFSLSVFGIIALTVVGTDSYRLISGQATEYSSTSLMIITALVGFFSGVVSGYVEAKRHEDSPGA
jgi:Co/Zn/Cd efflux system component